MKITRNCNLLEKELDERGIYVAVFRFTSLKRGKDKSVTITQTRGVYCPLQEQDAVTRQIDRHKIKNVVSVEIKPIKITGKTIQR